MRQAEGVGHAGMKSKLKFALILAAAGALCFYMGWIARGPDAAPGMAVSSEAEDPIERYREVRQAAYAREEEQLRLIAHDPAAEAEIASLARSRLAEISGRVRMENRIESLIALRGMDAAVSVNAYSCYVFVRAELLTAAEAGLILQLACEESGLGNDNVKIIPLNCGIF